MIFEHPFALLGLLSIIVLILLSFFKLIPQKVLVPSLLIWSIVKDRNPKIKELKKPRVSSELIIQIFAVIFAVLALSNPQLIYKSAAPKTIIFILDTSASMLTKTENGKSSIDLAKEFILNSTNSLSNNDNIIIMYSYNTPVVKAESKSSIRKVLDSVKAGQVKTDLNPLISHALEISGRNSEHKLILLSDRDIETSMDSKITKVLLGNPYAKNAGIVDMEFTDGYLFVRIYSNLGKIRLPVEIIANEEVTIKELDLNGPYHSFVHQIPNSSINRIRINLKINDSLNEDNHAGIDKFPFFKPIKVSYNGNSNEMLIRALCKIHDGIELSFSNSDTDSIDISIFYQTTPVTLNSKKHTIVIDPPNNFSEFVFGSAFKPNELSFTPSALLDEVKPRDVNIDLAKEISGIPNIMPLIKADGKNISLYNNSENGSLLILAFDLWPPNTSFPIFWSNYLHLTSLALNKIDKYLIHKTCHPLVLHSQLKLKINSNLNFDLFNSDTTKTLKTYQSGEYSLEMESQQMGLYSNLLDENESNNTGVFKESAIDLIDIQSYITSSLSIYFVILSIIFMAIAFYLNK